MPTTTTTATTEHPLASDVKLKFLQDFQQWRLENGISDEALIPVLQEAAWCFKQFPEPLHQKLKDLQSALKVHNNNEKVLSHIKKVITEFFHTEGIGMWNTLLKELPTDVEKFDAKQWRSSFIHFLAQKLQKELEQQHDIEVVIENGKLYWRLTKSDNTEFNKHETFFSETTTNRIVRMPWEWFTMLKNGGKRSGNVVIDEKLFVSKFPEYHRDQAAAIHAELKEKGILNEKNRLTDYWRVCSGKTMSLQSLADFVIKRREVQVVVSKLKKDTIWTQSEENFVNEFIDKKKQKAAFIWKKLSQKKVIMESNKKMVVTIQVKKLTLNFPEDEGTDVTQAKLNLEYSDIVKVLYDIVQSHQTEVAGLKTFRKERSRKDWCNSSGRITNNKEADPVTLWDVCIYDNLSKLKREKSNIDYDHIPSCAVLKRELKPVKTRLEEQLKELEKTATQQKTITKKKQTEQEISEIKAKLLLLTQELDKGRISKESQKDGQGNDDKGEKKYKQVHGPYWWTIAIPSELHQQGLTFAKSTAEQVQLGGHPFLRDISHYLRILESGDTAQYFQALSAFRYMYRCQTKDYEPIGNQVFIGSTPKQFFINEKDLQQLDKFFMEKLQDFMNQHA